MIYNKFRAVLTILGKDKILELRFDGLNEQRTHVDVKIIKKIYNETVPDARISLTSNDGLFRILRITGFTLWKNIYKLTKYLKSQ